MSEQDVVAGSTATERVRMRIRPKFSLLGNAFAAIVLGTTPIFCVSYWFASTRGGLAVVIVAHLIVLAIGLALVWRQLSVFCELTDTELRGNGIFSPTIRVPLADVAEAHLVPTYIGASPNPVTQLLVLDGRGTRVFRMRGNFWHEADLRALATALPVRLDEVAEPMSVQDFFRSYPGAAYWFESSRPLQVAIVAVAALLALVAAVWIMASLGLPMRFFS